MDKRIITVTAAFALLTLSLCVIGLVPDESDADATDDTKTGLSGTEIVKSIFKYRLNGTEATVIGLKEGSEPSSLLIPSSVLYSGTSYKVVAIGDNAFDGYTFIKTINAHSVLTIGDGAFKGCTSLTTFNGNKVTEIGNGAFENCTSLATLNTPAATDVAIDAFSKCKSLTDVKIGTGVDTSIFKDADSLEYISINGTYHPIIDGNISDYNDTNATFRIGNSYYPNITTAKTEISDGDTILLLRDLTVTSSFSLDNSSGHVTFDLGGHTLTLGTGADIGFTAYTGKITNGAIVDAHTDNSKRFTAMAIAASCEVELEDVTIRIEGTDADSTFNNTGVLVNAGSSLTLSGNSRIESASTSGAYGSVGVIVIGNGNTVDTADLYITDNATIAVGQFGVSGDGTIGKTDNGGTTIEISGNASVSAEYGWGIYHPQNGTLSITDNAEISGITGIEMRSGTLEIDGGTVMSTATEFASAAKGDGPTTTGAAIAIVQHTTKQDISVGIHDGATISGPTGVYQADLQNNGEEAVSKISIEIDGGSVSSSTGDGKAVDVADIKEFISGGTFEGSVIEGAVIPGYEVSDNGSIQATEGVAKIGDDTYATLADAIAHAGNDDVIVLLDDVTESITIDADLTVTLDLNGHRITNAENEHTITNNGTLTITDGSSSGTGAIDNVSHACGAVVNYGDLTLESGTLTRSAEAGASPTDNGGNSWYVVDNHGNMAVHGGTIIADGRYSSLIRNIGTSADDRAEIVIDDGSISNGFIALKNDDFSIATINGGTITSSEQSLQNWGIATINGGTLNGNVISWAYNRNEVSLEMNDGDINGNVIATAYTSDKSQIGTTILPPTIDIKGGNIDGDLMTRYGGGPYVQLPEEDDTEDYAWIQASGGTFSSSIEDRLLADGFALVPGIDGTFGVVTSDTPSNITISEDGQIVDYETDGSVVTIPSDGEHEDVTLNLWYGETAVTVNGDVTGNVTVSYDPINGTEGSDLAFNLGISGMSVTGMSVTVTIPVAVEPGYHIDEDSVSAYSIVDGVMTTETAYASGDAIIIETDHNTPFYVSYDLEVDLPPFIPFPPEQGGDPVEVYPSGDGGSSDDGDDTLKVVACAAAAVIAAILVIVLASTYRKNR